MTEKTIITKNRLFYLLCFLSLLSIVFILVPITFQNDTFYTIKIGERIAKEGFVHIDNFTFLDGIAYSYPHWLYDYFIYMVYQLGGFEAIHISTMILTMILGGALLFISCAISKNRFVVFFVVFATLMNLSFNFTARAQLVTYLIFVCEYGVLYFYTQQKIGKIAFFMLMMIISVLIVNVHCATWVLFFLIALPFLVEKWLSGLITAKNYPLSSRIMAISPKQYSALFILITLIAAVLTGFLSPLGETPFVYLIKTYQGISTSMISEHQPMILAKNIAMLIFLLEIFYLLLFTRCQFYMSELLLLLGLSILAFLSVRQAAILFLINALIAPRLLVQAFNDSCPKRLLFYTTKINTIKGVIVTLCLLVPLCFVSHMYGSSVAKMTPVTDINRNKISLVTYDSDYPVKAMDYFEQNIDASSARIYTDYAFGSYALFRGYHPMVDSRADLYTFEFNQKHDYLKDILMFTSYQTYYDDFFWQFDINYILLSQNESLNIYLKQDDQYPIIYEDEQFIIYQRNE